MNQNQTDDNFQELWNLLAAEGEVPASSLEIEPASNSEEAPKANSEAGSQEQPKEPGMKPGSLLHDIERLASWQNKSEEDRQKYRALQTFFLEHFPEQQEAMQARIRKGQRFGAVKQFAYQCGFDGDAFSIVEADARYGELSQNLQKAVRESFEKGLSSCKRREAEQKAIRSGRALSSVRPKVKAKKPTSVGKKEKFQNKEPEMPKADLHGNDLRALEPAKQWTLVIDESGTVFDADPREQVKASKAGRFVGVLVPEGGLEPLHGEWHAVNNTSQLIDEVTQRILDGRVGVLGVESASVPYSQGDRWLDGVALLLDWVLRLMPVEGATSLEVLIEQRGDFTHKQPWGLLQRDCLYRLALAFPERAARIHLKIRAIRKNESRLNGYADALAFTWARTTATSRERLKRSGLANTCLLTANNCINAREMREAWDTFAQGVQIDPLRWWEWVRQPAAREPSTLLHGFLEALARETREDAFLWQSFMAEVKRRMARTPVDLASLEAAVDWLQSCKPDSEKLPPLARMVWLTVEHARANHEGQIAVAHSRELTRLESDLFDEAAPMVCHAQLHRAVQMTNRYAFEKAEALLLPWLDHPAAVPGLRYYAHVLSSLGQHAAFQGRFQVARARFAKALEPIARLSDRAQALLDEAQTRAYLSIVLMDDPEASDEEVWREVVQVIGPLEKAAALSRTNDPARRYSLHLLLRGLCLRKNPDVEQAVVDCVDRWATGEGHPWPLIQAYRGLLMMERDQALGIELLREGALLAEAPGQGPTVALIGACIRNLATAYGEDWPGRDKQIETLAGQLPAAKDRIALLHTPPPAGRAAAMRFLSQVLPFNFH